MESRNDSLALHKAAQEGNVPMLASLLSGNPDLSILNENRMTPLHVASYSGSWNCFIVLLEKTPVTAENKTYLIDCLFEATRQNHPAAVKAIWNKGISINAVNEHGDRCVHLAIRQKNMKMLNLLLSFGPDLTRTNGLEKIKPLLLAIHHQFYEGVEKILTCTIERSPNDRKILAEFLPRAIELKQIPLLQQLLRCRLPTDILQKNLNDAIEKDDPDNRECIYLLLKYVQIDPAKKNNFRKIVYNAICEKRSDIAQLLIDQGVPADWCDPDQKPKDNCLNAAARTGDMNLFERLLSSNRSSAIHGDYEVAEKTAWSTFKNCFFHLSRDTKPEVAARRHYSLFMNDRKIRATFLNEFVNARLNRSRTHFFSRLPDGILLHTLGFLAHGVPKKGNKIISEKVNQILEARNQKARNKQAKMLAKKFTDQFWLLPSLLQTEEAQTLISTLKSLLKKPDCTAERIGETVQIFIRTLTPGPRKEKSNAQRLLEASGLLEFVPTTKKEDTQHHRTALPLSSDQNTTVPPSPKRR